MYILDPALDDKIDPLGGMTVVPRCGWSVLCYVLSLDS